MKRLTLFFFTFFLSLSVSIPTLAQAPIATPPAAATAPAAAPPSKAATFQDGVALYNQKKWDQAKATFTELLQRDDANAGILYNLGLTELKLGQKGWALAHWRRALALDPSLSKAERALKTAQDKFNLPVGEKSPLTLVLNDWSRTTPWALWFLLVIVTGWTAGWLLLSYFGRRKRALAEETILPPAPLTGALLMIAFAVCLSIAVYKWNYLETSRATVVSAAAPLQSAPAKDGVTLTQIPEGTEVTVHRAQNDWAQVESSDGLTGWVSKDNLYVTSKAGLW